MTRAKLNRHANFALVLIAAESGERKAPSYCWIGTILLLNIRGLLIVGFKSGVASEGAGNS